LDDNWFEEEDVGGVQGAVEGDTGSAGHLNS